MIYLSGSVRKKKVELKFKNPNILRKLYGKNKQNMFD